MNRVAQHPVQAFAAALGAVAILSIMDAVMKALVIAIGIYSVSIWRSVTNLVLTGALYLPRRLPWPSRQTLKIHVARGVVVTVMAALFFWGIGRVPLAQAIALTFIAPLIALILAALFLHERIGRRSVAGSFAAFAGVLVIVLGQARADLGEEVLVGSLAIVGSALCYACNIVLMRHQSLAAKPLEINFFQSITVLALWLAAVPFFGVPHWPAGWWMWILTAALMSTAGGLLFSWAYARAEASYLAVTEYSAFLWASALGWLIFREPVSLYTVAGAALIVGGCAVAARGKVTDPPEMDYT
ncbi:DMT family transporter [Sphingomonas hankyongi]|uniref:DMT family transporter n=1 Tax=Sphingomonas hankyongi TaxID=2908209 RepID=A0ABT0S5B2_9SPHN|nr:DMT family transporter [Sphingomonas hankyongi]MCL6730828.1 DMT family transporter [Sphingomonas hankyongi]